MNGRLCPKRKLILFTLLLCTTGSIITAPWYARVIPVARDHYMWAMQNAPTVNPLKSHAMLTAVYHVRGLSKTVSSSLAHIISSKLIEGKLPSLSPSFDCFTPFDGKYTTGTTLHEPDLFTFAIVNECRMPHEGALIWCKLAKEYIDKTILHKGIQTAVDTVRKRYLLPKLFAYLGPEWEATARFDGKKALINLLPNLIKKVLNSVDTVVWVSEYAQTGIGLLALLKIRHEIYQLEQSIQNADSITINFENDLPTLYWYSTFQSFMPSI